MLMQKAPLMIFDDSLSAVDTETDAKIRESINHNVRGTTIIIAHRISTIERMDKILFIDDGKLAAVGKHDDLYETCPAYRKMVDLQKLEEEGGAHNA